MVKPSGRQRMYLPALSILAVVVMLLVFISVSTYRNLDRDQRKAYSALYREATGLVHTLKAVARSYGEANPIRPELANLLKLTADSNTISYIYIISTAGDLVFHSQKEVKDRIDIIPGPLNEMKEPLTRVRTIKGTQRIYEMATPLILNSGTNSLILVIGLKMTDFDAAHQADMHHAVIMAAIVIVLGAGAIFFIFVIQNYYMVDKTLKETQDKVRRAEKFAAVGKLAAGVAHEIRNPLSSIKGFAQFLMHALKDRPEEKEYAAVMVREIDRINRVVTDLITYARPLTLEHTQINIEELVAHALRLVEQDAKSKQVVIHQKIATRLHDIWLDENQIIQVLLNLLLNAIQAISVQGNIAVGAEGIFSKNLLHLWVEDDGKGITEEHMEKILDPFFTTRNKGTGIGLAIVQKIVENHSGKMTIKSPPPGKVHGTKVSLFFPWHADLKKDDP